MQVNSSMTLYHKVYDSENRIDTWERHVIPKVFWTGGKGANVNKGYDGANDVTIRIWKQYNDLTDITFSIGDIAVKGEVSDTINVQTDLDKYDDVYNITSIVDNNYGTVDIRHIHLGGK